MNNLLVKAIPINKGVYGNSIIGYYLKLPIVKTDSFGTPRKDINGEYIYMESDFVYCEEYDDGSFMEGLIMIESNSIGFYVGNDCNGNKVFIGDKIKYANKLIYEVTWDSKNCKVKLVNLTNNIQSIGFSTVKEFIRKCEVIND